MKNPAALSDIELEHSIKIHIAELRKRTASGNKSATTFMQSHRSMFYHQFAICAADSARSGKDYGVWQLLMMADFAIDELANLAPKHLELLRRWAAGRDRWPAYVSKLSRVDKKFVRLCSDINLGSGLRYAVSAGKTVDDGFYAIARSVVTALSGAGDARLERWRGIVFCPSTPELEALDGPARRRAEQPHIVKLGKMKRSNWKTWKGPAQRFLDVHYGNESTRNNLLEPRLKYSPNLSRKIPHLRKNLVTLPEMNRLFLWPNGSSKFSNFLKSETARWNRVRGQLLRRVRDLMPP